MAKAYPAFFIFRKVGFAALHPPYIIKHHRYNCLLCALPALQTYLLYVGWAERQTPVNSLICALPTLRITITDTYFNLFSSSVGWAERQTPVNSLICALPALRITITDNTYFNLFSAERADARKLPDLRSAHPADYDYGYIFQSLFNCVLRYPPNNNVSPT